MAEAVSEVETVADDLNEATSEIDTVATNIANVNTVGNINANVTTVAGISANVTTVAGISSNVTAVANNSSNINSAVSNATNINTVAGAITNVNNVGGAIANVNSVATNLASVNNFAERYRVSGSAPTSSLDVGDLWFDSSSNTMKVYSASGFQNAGSSVNGTADRYQYTATSGQTTFSGNDSAGNSLAYDPLYLDVFLNGVRLANADFTATNGSSIVLASGAAVGDILSVTAYGTFSLAAINANNISSGTLSTGRGGTGLTTLGSAGQAIVVNAAGNALEFSNASSAEVYGFETYFTASTLVKTVTDSGGKYYIDGVQQDTLELLEGNTYVFNYPSGHPFKFSTTSDGTHGGGSEYTTGVTHNSSTQVTIVVATDAPTLYYYCASHSAMGGTANTPVPSENSLRVITTNQGQDNISNTTYANFDDVLYAASGFTWGVTNGELIATI